jgi:hypothetical protein
MRVLPPSMSVEIGSSMARLLATSAPKNVLATSSAASRSPFAFTWSISDAITRKALLDVVGIEDLD